MAVLKTVRNTAIVVVSILILVAGLGVAYVYVTDQSGNTKQESIQTTDDLPKETGRPKATIPRPDAPVGAALLSITTPVEAGANSSISIRTTPTATCSIKISYGDLESKDSGLATKKADDFGTVTWSWTVDKSAPAGKWPIKVTCKYGKRSAYVQGELEVTK